MRYSLRIATEADYGFLYALEEATMREYVVHTYGRWDDAFQARRFREKFDPSTIRIIVVASRAVGMVQTERTDSEVFLANIRVSPAQQGQGLGTVIIANVLEEAHQANLPVRLRVLKVNPVRGLYERLGFSLVEETPTHYIMRALPGT